MSFASVKAILDAHDYNALIGLDEDAWLEAKGKTPYNFATAYGHYELAKDVSAFANADGGILIVGLATTRLPESKIERITAHDLCTQAEFPIQQYEGLIRTHIHPSIRGLRIHWLPVSPDGNTGLGVIEVPEQSQNQKYFLNAKVVDSGALIKQIVFGVAKRVEAANDPLSINELHKTMQTGKGSVPETLARMETKIDYLIESRIQPMVHIPLPEEAYDERAADILDEDPQ